MSEAPVICSFDDFRIGQTFAGGSRRVTEEDIARFSDLGGDFHPLHRDDSAAQAQGYASKLAHGPLGLSAFFGWFFDLSLARADIVGLLNTDWHYVGPIYAGDTLSFRMIITGCRRTSTGDRGIVTRSVEVLNQSGTVVQKGNSALMYRSEPGRRRLGQELFTSEWAKALAERLNANAAFVSAMATWDGAFGLGNNRDEVAFRIYRGRIIEAGTRPPRGTDFAVHADGATWSRLMTGADGLFMIEAMQGAFSVRGNAYEYLRFTKALSLVVSAMRDFAQEGAEL
ncbi:MaoC/PaaZ C-terminal domain-containing protein [Sinorhizobium mexicanum]|nr:MaoC/PaaZ C-terminal domain-containing protein [Sinorhizobium mexicanum]MBP1888084.1 acyl dehydratase/putative sterol carrier protein [Sinorhizobium mexicanum]